ncbi:SpoIIE family protein phosphatase, partial [Streptomyces sp. NPDC005568]
MPERRLMNASSTRTKSGAGRFALVIGDVQGHDVRAAGLMGQLR